jgi:hypothetical protein
MLAFVCVRMSLRRLSPATLAINPVLPWPVGAKMAPRSILSKSWGSGKEPDACGGQQGPHAEATFVGPRAKR